MSSAAGHSYFSLKDEQSLLRCVMFKGQPGSELLTDGASVSAHGHISFYERGGTTDFVVDLAMPQGMGELALELETAEKEAGTRRTLPGQPQTGPAPVPQVCWGGHLSVGIGVARHPECDPASLPIDGTASGALRRTGSRCRPRDYKSAGKVEPRRAGRGCHNRSGRRVPGGLVALQ